MEDKIRGKADFRNADLYHYDASLRKNGGCRQHFAKINLQNNAGLKFKTASKSSISDLHPVLRTSPFFFRKSFTGGLE